MGLGKTIQSISILQYLFNERDIAGPFLIIAPMSTVEQWKREIETWTEMNAIIFHGSENARNLIFKHEWFFSNSTKSKLFKFHIMITTYEVAMIEAPRLRKIPWQYTIIDEGHRIKNNNSKLFQTLQTFRTAYKLILTGTPLQNGMKELWALLNYLNPNVFDDCDEFLEEFGDLKKSEQVTTLHKK